MNGDSTEVKPKVNQASFTEESIREGFTLEDIKMWQNLCKQLALLAEDAEETMHGMLAICDKEGISPLAVCLEMRSMGYKTCEEGISPAIEHYFGRSDDNGQYPDGERDERDNHDPDADEDDRVEVPDHTHAAPSWKQRKRFEEHDVVEVDDE